MWVKYQRQQLLRFIARKEPCFINQRQIDQLDQFGFAWRRPLDQPRKNTNPKDPASPKRSLVATEQPNCNEHVDDDSEERENVLPNLDPEEALGGTP